MPEHGQAVMRELLDAVIAKNQVAGTIARASPSNASAARERSRTQE